MPVLPTAQAPVTSMVFTVTVVLNTPVSYCQNINSLFVVFAGIKSK